MKVWESPPRRPRLEQGEVHLWRAVICEVPLQELRPHLSEDEQARVDRFVVERPKQELVAGRGMLRELLGLYLDRRPGELRFRYGKDGKPQLEGERTPLSFNLSHSHGLVLLALSAGGDLGVDVERVRHDMEHLKVSERFFSARERRSLSGLPLEDQALGFFRCWTRKEALLKARGTGLRTPLRDFDVSLAPDEPAAILATRFSPPDEQTWDLRHVDPGPGYTAALALSFRPSRLKTWEWTPRED